MKAKRPSHAELARQLAVDISGSRYQVGMRFWAEAELQARFKVGRHTAREALKTLTEQGLIGRRARVGTIILSKKPVSRHAHTLRNLRELLDFSDRTVFEVRERDFVAPLDAGRKSSARSPKKTWLRITGVRKNKGDQRPLCLAEVFIPEKFVQPALENDVKVRGFFENTLAHFSLKLEYVEQEVSAVILSARLAAILKAKVGSAALSVQRRYIAHTGETFEIAKSVYPADRYAMQNVLRQRP